MVVEFRLFGGVEARLDGQPLALGPARQRCVLAVLLTAATNAVTSDELVERVWAQHPPQQVRSSLHSYLTRLRTALAPVRNVRILRQGSGYTLLAEENDIDLCRFRGLIAAARECADDEQAAAQLAGALALFRGEPFAGLDTPWLNGRRAALHQEHLTALLDHADLALRLGRHAELVAGLSAATTQHPLDERLAGQLMLALYRCGRQAEALDHYQRVRSTLAQELGVDPGTALSGLHQQILTADAAILAPPRDLRPAAAPVPRQLPNAPSWFAGRADELTALTNLVDTESGVTVVISAAGGAGKTWLALRWAHQNLHRFPDGQLFVNLRGFDPTGTPTTPETAVRGLLDALGVHPAALPLGLDAQASLYRSLVADKRMLIVADNAADAAQVVPLLPGSPATTVLVTSRARLTALVSAHGARPLPMDVLPEPDARAVLTARLGASRLAAEPEATAELLTHCAGLPLALGIVAARAQTHPELPLTGLAAELRDATTRLAALDEDQSTSVRAALSWSYAALPAEQATVFALLGLCPGPDIGLPAAAALTGLTPDRAGANFRALERMSLLRQISPGRYRMHDLVRLYAAEQATHDNTEAARDAALRRLADYHVHTALGCERLLDPHSPRVDAGVPASNPDVALPADVQAALAWFDTEHANLLAVIELAARRGWHRAVWHLAWALNTFHVRRGHVADNVDTWRTALAATTHLDDLGISSEAHRRLGSALSRAQRHTEALDHLDRALALAREAGDLPAQGYAHYVLAIAWGRLDDDRTALEHANHVLRVFSALDAPIWQAQALNQSGWYLGRLGEHDAARSNCLAALGLFRRHGNLDGQADTLDSLGYLAHRTGDHVRALGYYQQALGLCRELGDTYGQADLLDQLGHIHLALLDRESAHDAWAQAARLLRTQHRTELLHRVEHRLAVLDGRPVTA